MSLNTNACSVLLVEDEAMLSKMMALDLEDEGASVTLAHDGEQAIAILETMKPDIILLDILMPRKDGFAVLRHLKEQNASTPVVMLTNLSEPEHEDLCRSLGARDFIVKSDLDSGELWQFVKKYLPQPV